MKSKFRILFLIICLVSFQDADAQLFKRLKKRAKEKAKNLENKVLNKVDEEVDKTIDGAIEGRGNPNQGKPTPPKTAAATAKKDFGDITINHTQKYGSVAITETSQVKVNKTDSGYTISGNWWSHQADIYDGFNITIKTDQDLKDPNATKRMFSIPDEATFQLGYDPQLPYNKKSEDNFKRAVTDDYQNYDLTNGLITINMLSDTKVQITFSGAATFRTVIRQANSDDFSESFYEASITGQLDSNSPKFISEETVTQTNTTQNTSNTGSGYSITPTSGTAPAPGIYQFSYETVTEISVPGEKKAYKMSYLLNPNTKYIGMKVDVSEYSDGEMNGESIIVMDEGNAHVFVETAGMKMRMSNGMMGQKMQNPTEQMANYDYTKLQKTGNTKTILGATCHEYMMADKDIKINFWVAPDIKLSNWFIQNTGVIDGYIMEYAVESKDGKMTSKTLAIKENISKTINPKEYKKMF
ncbi:MAG: hypothetical protein AAF617_01770 [Bacteroidota bacterium]